MDRITLRRLQACSLALLAFTGIIFGAVIVDDARAATEPAITHAATIDLPGVEKPRAVQVEGNYAYVADAAKSQDLVILDISTRTNPTVVGTHNTSALITTGRILLEYHNDTVYIQQKNAFDIYIINVTDRSNPMTGATEQFGFSMAKVQDIEINPTHDNLYVSGKNEMSLDKWNIDDPQNPAFVGERGRADTSYYQMSYHDGKLATYSIMGSTIVYIYNTSATGLGSGNVFSEFPNIGDRPATRVTALWDSTAVLHADGVYSYTDTTLNRQETVRPGEYDRFYNSTEGPIYISALNDINASFIESAGDLGPYGSTSKNVSKPRQFDRTDDGYLYVPMVGTDTIEVYTIAGSTVEVISGTVVDDAGDPIQGAKVEAVDNATGNVVENTTTDASGNYSMGLGDGTYNVTAGKIGYFNETKQVTISGADVTLDFTLVERNAELVLEVPALMEHDARRDYVVYFTQTNKSTGVVERENVSSAANVSSDDKAVIFVDDAAFDLLSTSNESVAAVVNITANYTADDGTQFRTTEEVVVANATVENIEILPPAYRISASLDDSSIFAILIATLVGVVGARFSTSFGGLALLVMGVIVAWFGGFVGTGVMLVAVIAGTFIGLNVAANVEYSTHRGGG